MNNSTAYNESAATPTPLNAATSVYQAAWYILELNVATSIVCSVGFLAVLCNACMLIVIASTSKLQNGRNSASNFSLLTGLVVADLILGLGYFLTQAYSLLFKNVAWINANTTNLVCALISTVHVLGSALGELIMLCIAFERFVAVALPFRYWEGLSNRLLLILCVLASTAICGCAFIGIVPNGRPGYTGILSGYNGNFTLYWVITAASIGYTTTVIYFAVLFVFVNRRNHTLITVQPSQSMTVSHIEIPPGYRLSPDDHLDLVSTREINRRQNRQNRLTYFIIILIACKLLTTQVGYTIDVVNWLTTPQGSVNSGRISKWCTVLVSFNTLSNIIVYPWKNPEIQTAFKKIIRRIRDTVMP